MLALILKDINTLKKTLLLTIPMSIAIAVYGIYENAIFMIPLICVMIPLILTAIAFGYDNKSNFEQFAFSMPIKKSSYVLSKLFFAFAFGLVGSICIFILLITKNQLTVDNILLFSLMTLVASILMSAIQLPFILKYGAEKGRLILVITYFLIFALSTLLKEKSDFLVKLMETFSKYSLAMICLGSIVISVLIVGIAIKASIMIMEQKEY
ncbi:ABC-2 transporter permease [Tuanshanicoccus lijuaniae]|uniref:ABC-2 transporter permease n=1 Tax=Aerococcaceae bacterium zg-1292 TaxID=2774330 RepID=UPI0019383F32|nr:ABC-2 transporter permease [Aerococcaceae bacterium zg-1292]MBF6977901.1 ABC-2 transporter permease [Aerococcaceae bacterium zg-BR22]MBS4455893.1 ABC-2 transporter permease [Aerococcaceae bacterium zg-A91]MBS4457569.1 ABC-2 transporter permease [Aerococcaceae bacterium zg-BR33]QQA38076.1 ABC-2 transporter permease [Aerococcaceae bacterium zg-1292]